MARRWAHRDFALPAEVLAPALLGHRLVRVLDSGERVSGLIVETEAYLGVEDRACHSYNGRRTARTEVMYARAGTAYVYFTYGMHHCFNIVCGHAGEPVAVLVRALQPEEGLERMRMLRAGPRGSKRGERAGERAAALKDTELCSGPARLCRALDIDRRHTGLDLTLSADLFVEMTAASSRRGLRVERSARIGVGYAGAWAGAPLRFSVVGNAHVSR